MTYVTQYAENSTGLAGRSRNIVCNPIDIAYRYQDVRFSGSVGGIVLAEPRRSVHREGADPSIVRFQDRYFMFVSMSRGFWHSVDLASWTYQVATNLPPYDYAPDVRVVDDALIISASRKGVASPFFRSVDPLADDFTEITPGTFEFWDPNTFQDDDGRIYFYWGCGNTDPLRGVELTKEYEPIGAPVDLIVADPDNRGWERTGENYQHPEPKTDLEKKIASFMSTAPYIEGAWMTRRNGTYYLQYAAPGTQWNSYADGYFTSSNPLGPFVYSPESPFSSKPGGFITGAGHGSTFQDDYGNWWHAATMRISVNDVFERRVGLFPAGFDDNGVLFCNQNFGDYPFPLPTSLIDPRDRVAPEWMLLSYRATARASSAAAGHAPTLAVDEDIRTWWASDGSGAGQWIEIDLGQPRDVHAIQVNLADHDLAAFAPHLTEGKDQGHTWRGIYADHTAAELTVDISADGENWTIVHDGTATSEDQAHPLIVLEEAHKARFVRVRAQQLPFAGPFAVSGLRVFGTAEGPAPAQVEPSGIRTDPLTAHLEWSPAHGAHGYNIRYGTSPDRLYRSWLVYENTSLELPTLNAQEKLWCVVDAFNEAGVTFGIPFEVTSASE